MCIAQEEVILRNTCLRTLLLNCVPELDHLHWYLAGHKPSHTYMQREHGQDLLFQSLGFVQITKMYMFVEL